MKKITADEIVESGMSAVEVAELVKDLVSALSDSDAGDGIEDDLGQVWDQMNGLMLDIEDNEEACGSDYDDRMSERSQMGLTS